MKKIGLVAGGGSFPVEFVKAVKAKGDKVTVFAISGVASTELDDIADKIYWLKIGQFAKFTFLMLKERIKELVLLGKISKTVIYNEKGDAEAETFIKKVKDRKDYSLLEEITRKLGHLGVHVSNGMEYLSSLLPSKGFLTTKISDPAAQEDISFGYGIIKKIAGMDIGQTIIIKDKAVVAVEAMEGTDDTIKRGKKIAGEGCVMVKVARPDQDMRWDVPVVGSETIELLIENGYKALAIESDKMYIVDKDKVIDQANHAGFVIEVL